MAIVTSDLLAALTTDYKVIFEQTLYAAQNLARWRDIATRVDSTTDTESYNWLQTPPVPQDTTHDPLTFAGLDRYNFTIQNKTWQSGVQVRRETYEDDRFSIIPPRIRQLAQRAVAHPGQLIMQLFEQNPDAFDGVPFFDTTRVIGNSGNINNIVSGSGVDTVAHVQADLAAARAAGRKFKDDQGQPMNLVLDTIVCSPDTEQIIFQALNANQGTIFQPVPDGGIDPTLNPSYRGYRVLVNPFLTDVDDWYLLFTGDAYKPFVYQERLAPALENIITPDNQLVVLGNVFTWTSRARYNIGVSDPRFAILVQN